MLTNTLLTGAGEWGTLEGMDSSTSPAPEQPVFNAEAVAAGVTQHYSVDRPQIQKVRYTHDAMIDVIITNPGISQGALAKYFDKTQSWVCTIMSSDAFQVRLAQRRHELVDPEIMASIEERFKALATISVNKLLDHLNQPAIQIDPEVMLKAAALGAKALGIGGNAAPKTVILSSEERLQSLAGRLTNLNKQSKEGGIIDVQAKETDCGLG